MADIPGSGQPRLLINRHGVVIMDPVSMQRKKTFKRAVVGYPAGKSVIFFGPVGLFRYYLQTGDHYG
jgi:hypothetical protein